MSKFLHTASRQMLAAALCGMALVGIPIAHAEEYEFTELLFGGTTSSATGLSATGDVIGQVRMANDTHIPFLYSGGRMIDIRPSLVAIGFDPIRWGGTDNTKVVNSAGQVAGSFGVPQVNEESERAYLFSNGLATDIGYRGPGIWMTGMNTSGHITGWVAAKVGSGMERRPFVFRDGKLTILTLLPEPWEGEWGATKGTSSGEAHAINSSGDVVGRVYQGDSARAFVYRDGRMISLGTLGGQGSIARAITDDGDIVGDSRPDESRIVHAFLYKDGRMADLGTLWGESVAFAINATGQIVGRSKLQNNDMHAVLWKDGQIIDLGTLGNDLYAEAFAINASGHILGRSVRSDGQWRPFLYKDGTMLEVASLHPNLAGRETTAAPNTIFLNDAGQIAGSYRRSTNQEVAFLLTPKSGSVVLSPAGVSLVEGGLAGTYAVVLSKSPTANVTLTISSGTQTAVSPGSLTFTPANWNIPQTVSVQAVQDGIAEGNHTALIKHTVSSGDPRYNGIKVADLMVAITEALAPTLSLSVPAGAFWTSPSLAINGTAAPGAVVTISAANISVGELRAVTVITGADGRWNVTLTDLVDGVYELQAEASGLKSPKATVAVDINPPLSTLALTPANPASSGWYLTAVSATMAANDGTNGSGVAKSEYALDSGSWTPFPSSISVSTDGNHSLCYRSTDKAGNREVDRCDAVRIDATAPIVMPIFDMAINTLNLNAQDAVSGVSSIEISRDGGINWTSQGGPITFNRDGFQTVHYRIKDAAGNQTTGQTTVNVATVPVVATSDQTADEGSVRSFSLGSFTDQVLDSPWSVDVDWGDGSAHTIFSVTDVGNLGYRSHAYADSGKYAAVVKVTDRAGNTGTKTFQVVVANIAPTAPFSTLSGLVNEGGSFGLMFGGPVDPSTVDMAAGFRYAFDCGDGKGYGPVGSASTTTCPALDNPNQTAKGKVLDKDEGETEYNAVIGITNLPPVLGSVVGPTSPVTRDSALSLSASFTDPGVLDTHTITVDWDDGNVTAGTVNEANGSGAINATHSYAHPGKYTARLTLADKDGMTSVSTYVIHVKGGPPADKGPPPGKGPGQ